MILKSDGKVGIGTTSPGSRLVVQGAASENTEFQINSVATNLNAVIRHNDGTNSVYSGLLGASGGGAGNWALYATAVRMVVQQDGKVGIGTDSPQKDFVVSNAGAEGYEIDAGAVSNLSELISYNRSTSAWNTTRYSALSHEFYISGSPKMTISSSGNVGIGETAPTAKLHVFTGDSGFSGAIDTDYDEFCLESSGNTGMTILSPAANYGSIVFGDNADKDMGRIKYYHGTDSMQFFVNNNTDPTMTISGSGNVGIGTTAPDGKLHVMGASAGSITANANADEAVFEGGGDTGISILSPDGNWGALFFGSPSNDVNAAISGDYSGGSEIMRFWVGDQSAAKMTLNNSGNLGIGTTSPDYKLQVDGDIAPETTNTYDLGSTTKRWANVYAGDLHLQNEVGDWTVEEGEEELFITNNKTGKKYAIMMREIE